MNILFTCAGRRNYLINYFKDNLSGGGKVIVTDASSFAVAAADADISVVVPSIYDEKYIDSIVDVIKEYSINAVISLNDLELPILSRSRVAIEAAGAKLLVSAPEVVDIASDKVKTVEFTKELGLNFPQTYINLDESVNAVKAGKLKLPLVVKPRWGSGSIGVEIPESERELRLSYELVRLKIERSMLGEISRQDIDSAVIIQEKLSGQEYGMDILNDFDGNYIGTFVRKKLAMRAGETDRATSVIDERFEILGRQISRSLRHIGNLDCDVFDCGGELFLLELNPRFGGGYPFSYEAGANSVAIYIELLRGEKPSAERYLRYLSGKTFGKCDRLIEL